MSPHSPAPGSTRSSDDVNRMIRALVRGARDREWTQAERALYGLLIVEWETARRAELVTAA